MGVCVQSCVCVLYQCHVCACVSVLNVCDSKRGNCRVHVDACRAMDLAILASRGSQQQKGMKNI